MKKPPTAIFIVPTDFKSLKDKGVLNILDDREEMGRFKKLYIIHPFTKERKIIKYSAIQEIHEFCYKNESNFLLLKLIVLLKHLISITMEVKKITRKEKIDFIRSQDPYVSGLIGLMLSKFLNRKLCISIHADYEKRHLLDPEFGAPKILGSRKFAEYIKKITLKSSDLILPIRKSISKKLILEGFSPSKIRTFPHVLDLSEYNKKPDRKFLKNHKIKNGTKIISYVGRFSKENYIYDYIEILKRLLTRYPNILLIMAGDGVETKYIKKILEKNKILKSKIILLGFVSQKDIQTIRKLSYINLSLMGGFSLIEACASGRPVISYNVEWHAELIKNNESGILIEEENIPEVCHAIEKLFKNPDLAKKLGENAKKIAFDKHHIQTNSNLRMEIYKELF